MTLKDRITGLFTKVRTWFQTVNWRHVAKNIINFIGNVMHKILFEWLMPNKNRGIKKK